VLATPRPTPRPEVRVLPTPVAVVAPTAVPTPPPPTPEPAPTGVGELQVGVRPYATEVWVDGQPRGGTPFRKLELPAGPHTVRIRHPLYEVVERRIVVRPGETAKVLVDFTSEGVRK
jgi:hypothetical protein